MTSPGAGRPPSPRVVVTIGVFDGVHLGHRALLDRLKERAGEESAETVVVSFRRHPLAVLNPQRCPPSLTTTAERRQLLESAGIQHVLVVDFDHKLARTSARDFLDQMIVPHFQLVRLVIGPDFAMGRDRHGDPGVLERLGVEMGFSLESVAAVPLGGAPVSSTRIRTLIASGLVDQAALLLARDYSITGTCEVGEGRGRAIGFPTANVAVPGEKLVPQNGVYAATVQVAGSPAIHPAVLNIGVAPTFGGTRRRLEVHLLGFEGDLLGRELTVLFRVKLRDEKRFESVEALRSQIETDAAEAAQRLSSNA